jgi:hypothetical protein
MGTLRRAFGFVLSDAPPISKRSKNYLLGGGKMRRALNNEFSFIYISFSLILFYYSF